VTEQIDAQTVVTAPARPALAPGLLLVGVILSIYGSLALTVDFPRAAMGIHSDEATYYMMGHSVAHDGDLTYRREDLVRVWREFSTGPSGLFLKRGEDILEAGPMLRPPFFWTRSQSDPDTSRLFYGKSFIYPLVAAPFVAVFGTNGFLVFHALLLALAAWCSYLFLHARMPAGPAVLLAAGFIMVSVVPVYFVWITPELFNFTLGLVAYFCWLYKEVAPPPPAGSRARWLFGPASTLVAAALIGIATFSKPTNALLFVPIAAWLVWRRQWARAVVASSLFLLVAVGLFGANMAITGEWNYQGGRRITLNWEFPFQTAGATFDALVEKQKLHARDEALTEIIFDRTVFWTNFVHNVKWYFVGRYAGLIAYYFPAVFALVAYLAALRRRPPVWQHLVFAGAMAVILVFIVMTPYTWNGGGGSVGNRYFMSTYGMFLFLIPPITRTSVVLVPWIVGGIFTMPLVMNSFVASFRPGDNANSGPLRLLPVELTMVYDWPINTDPSRVRVWFGDHPPGSSPGFQIYFFDRNAYQREVDNSFWVKGETRAEFLIKTDRPMKRLVLTLAAGPVPTEVRMTLSGRSQEITLQPGESRQVVFAMGTGFSYQGKWPVWVASVSSSAGFTPIFADPSSTDTRFLGVRVRPTLVE
jgi:hypothetical protein